MNTEAINKIQSLDAAFLGTSESQGYRNAKNAIKLCVFDDQSVLKDKKIDYNKWLLISNKYNGRERAKALSQNDIAYILIKYCLTMFGMQNKEFNINESTYMTHRQNPLLSQSITPIEAVELVAFAAFNDLYSAYVFLFANQYVYYAVIDSLIENRYLNLSIDLLDNYDGKIKNDEVSSEFKYIFFKKYQNFDIEFTNLQKETM